MRFRRSFIKLLKANGLAIGLSVASALVLFFSCYFIDNLSYSFLGEATIGQHIEQIKQFFNSDSESIPEDLLLINVAYDRQLVDLYDEFGFPKGNIDITDRTKLLTLLSKLKCSNYKCVVLDVVFPDQYSTEEDASLFNLISSMHDIIIPKSRNITLADPRLTEKARYSDYSTHISETNFVKYEFIRDNEVTLPYQLYLTLYGNEILSWGPFYFFNGKLANKSVVLRHPIKLWNKYSSADGNEQMAENQYFDLGSDILDLDLNIDDIADNKIIVIGDFTENDIHDTYLGKIAGPIINLNAFYALKNDNLSLPYSFIVFLLLLYAVITFCIIKRISIFKILSLHIRIKSKTIGFVFSSLGVTALLTVVAVILYTLFSLECNILIPSIYFSILLALINYKYYRVS